MVKLKKALKKLAKLGAAKAAKKGTLEKKKSGPVSSAGASGTKKKTAAAAKPAKKVAAKKAEKRGDKSKSAPKASAKAVARKNEAPKPVKGKKGAPSAVASVTKRANAKTIEPAKGKKAIEKAVEKTSEQAIPKASDKVSPDKASKGKAFAKAEKTPEKSRKASKGESDEVDATSTDSAAGMEDDGPEEVILTDAEGRRYCRVKDCDQVSVVDGYCRYHYLLFWKKIQVRKKILTEGKLERYIEELTARYPDKYLEMLRKDLRTEKDFLAAITELEIDESGVDTEYEDEAQSYLEEVRGMSSENSTREEEEF